MKKSLILIFLYLTTCVGPLYAAPKKGNAVDTLWCRPVKSEAVSWNLIVNGGGDTITVFKGEWLQTQAKSEADIILGRDTLINDQDCHNGGDLPNDYKYPCCLDLSKRDAIFHGHQTPKVCCVRIKGNDSTLYVKVICPDTLAKKYMIIDQCHNKIINDSLPKSDRFEPVCLEDTAQHVFRVSLERHVSCIVMVDTVLSGNSVDSVGCANTVDSLLIYTYGGDTVLCEKNPNYVPHTPEPTDFLWKDLIALLLIVLTIVHLIFSIYKEPALVPEPTPELTPESTPEPTPDLSNLLNRIEDECLRNQIKEAHNTELEKIKVAQEEEIAKKDNVIAAKKQEITAKEQIITAKEKEIATKNDEIKTKAEEIASLNEIKTKFDKKVKEKEDSYQRKLNKAINDADSKIKSAENERDNAIREKREIESKLEKKHKQEINDLQDSLQNFKSQLETSKTNLNNTILELNDKNAKLNSAGKEIERLNESQEIYQNSLTVVTFANDYCGKVGKLLEVGKDVCKSATALLNIDTVKDYYHIMKAISKFEKVVATVDMAQLYTDVKMIMKGQMVLAGTPLSSFDHGNSHDSLKNSTKRYFFDSYLSKYVDALVVLNETCLAMNLLVDGLKADSIKVFRTYRNQINEAVDDLEIVVETTHLFDKVGEKTDLQVVLVDVGVQPGDILEIENCLVYLKGSDRPKKKIKVKAQS